MIDTVRKLRDSERRALAEAQDSLYWAIEHLVDTMDECGLDSYECNDLHTVLEEILEWINQHGRTSIADKC